MSFLLISAIMLTGTAGMHVLEHLTWLDAFYFMSMIATAQGPAFTPATAAGKIFASIISFVSVGCGVAALGFLFGPFLGRLWRLHLEHEKEGQRNKPNP